MLSLLCLYFSWYIFIDTFVCYVGNVFCLVEWKYLPENIWFRFFLFLLNNDFCYMYLGKFISISFWGMFLFNFLKYQIIWIWFKDVQLQRQQKSYIMMHPNLTLIVISILKYHLSKMMKSCIEFKKSPTGRKNLFLQAGQ